MIQIENLVRTYGKLRAVDGLSLTVADGEVFGFLGPNGAGKTTTIRILTNRTKPTSGRVKLNGFDLCTEPLKAKREFGVVQQHMSLDPELSCWECLELHARLQRIEKTTRRRRIDEILTYVGLGECADKRAGDLSGGMKRRLQIARALLHRPHLLFLDEPTVGLDAQARRRLWELVRRMNHDGTTVFLTTHYIEEAEELCDRVGVIHKGRLIALGSPLELRLQLGMFTVEVRSRARTDLAFFADVDAATDFARTTASDAKTVVVRESNLEDVFIELTGSKVEEGV